jgi:hypothetical protein
LLGSVMWGGGAGKLELKPYTHDFLRKCSTKLIEFYSSLFKSKTVFILITTELYR